MWTDKHKPSSVEGIVGQKKAIDEALPLLSAGGAGGKGKAALLFGPAGCGKTLLVEAIARQEGLQLLFSILRMKWQSGLFWSAGSLLTLSCALWSRRSRISQAWILRIAGSLFR